MIFLNDVLVYPVSKGKTNADSESDDSETLKGMAVGCL